MAGLLAGAVATPLAAEGPEIPEAAVRDIDFVPFGWKLYDKKEGDLNGDGQSDSILIIQATDPEKVIKNADGFGVDRYDANQRILLFVMSDPEGGMRLGGRDDQIIPDWDSPTMDDPYTGLAIKDGKASLFINFWASAGSWWMTWRRFHFRWDGQQMEVIGYDGGEGHRASGEMREVSINYLTGKRSDIKGSMFEDVQAETWTTIDKASQPVLGKIGNAFEFMPLSE